VVECRHELPRTGLRSVVGRVGFRDCDIRDADSFLLDCWNSRRAQSRDTRQRCQIRSDNGLFCCRDRLWCGRGRLRAFHTQVYESSEPGIVRVSCRQRGRKFSTPENRARIANGKKRC
jgi:hypothetical protein